jgi:hypothetical protein
VHPKCPQRQSAEASPSRAHARQQYARPASTAQVHAAWPHVPPAATSGAVAIPPGKRGADGAGVVIARALRPDWRNVPGT